MSMQETVQGVAFPRERTLLRSDSPLPYVSSGPHTTVLTTEEIAHAYRRLNFGVTQQDFVDAAGKTGQQLVSDLIDAALAAPAPPDPDWMDDFLTDGTINGMRNRLVRDEMLKWMFEGGLREHLTLFWSGHFVTEYANRPQYTWRWFMRCRTHAIGNFKDFVHEMGRDQAMLRYLNGNASIAGNPNENYARELLELFTMGRVNRNGAANYTEFDIVEISRALTGWQDYPDLDIGYFNLSRYDGSAKTIFGETGHWGYDEVNDLIFQKKGRITCEYICSILYEHFAYDVPNWFIIDRMADAMEANNYELRAPLEMLLASRHFFQSKAHGSRIKGPIRMHLGMLREADMAYNHVNDSGTFRKIYVVARDEGQELFRPPDVSGWSFDEQFISSTTLPMRADNCESILQSGTYQMPIQQLVPWAKTISGYSSDPGEIVDAVTRLVLSCEPDPVSREHLIVTFKSEIPQFEYDNGLWDLDRMEAPYQLRLLMAAIYRLPEYQLF